MLLRPSLLALLLAASGAIAQPPMPAPVPPGGEPADRVLTLKPGTRHVVGSKVRCDVLCFPKGLVEVEEKAGPRDWTGVFADGAGAVEDRHFAAPLLYAVRGKDGARGEVEVVLIPRGYRDRSEWVTVRLMVEAGTGPLPPPKPVDPKVDPPTPGGELRVLFIRESSANHGREVVNILNSTRVAAFAREKCAKSATGQPEFRTYDPQQQFAAKESPTMKALFADTLPKAKELGLPALVVAVGTDARVYALDGMTEADVLELLRKAAGVK